MSRWAHPRRPAIIVGCLLFPSIAAVGLWTYQDRKGDNSKSCPNSNNSSRTPPSQSNKILSSSSLIPSELRSSGVTVDQRVSDFSHSFVHGVLASDDTLGRVGDILVDAFQHPIVKAEIKSLLVNEFTENDVTIANLKQFIVDSVLKDEWVNDTLIEFAKSVGVGLIHDPSIWPKTTLELLKKATWDALQRSQFQEEVQLAFYESVSISFYRPIKFW